MESYSISNYKDSRVISGMSPPSVASKMFVTSPYLCFSMSLSGQGQFKWSTEFLSMERNYPGLLITCSWETDLKPECFMLSLLREIGGNLFCLKLFSYSLLPLVLRGRDSQIPFENLTMLCFIQNTLSCNKENHFPWVRLMSFLFFVIQSLIYSIPV